MFCFQVYYAVNPAFVAGRQDAWIVIGLAGMVTILITFMIARVSLLSPGKTIIEHSQAVLGKWIGRAVIVPYFLAWFSLMVGELRDWSDFVYLALLPRTPIMVVIVLMALMMTYVTLKGGLTAIGRCSEVIGPLFFIINFVPLFMMPGLMDVRQLQPVYVDSGWKHIVNGTIPSSAILTQAAMVPLMLGAFMTEPKKVVKTATFAIGVTCVLCLLQTVAYLFLFGQHLTPLLPLPWFAYLRSISILDFIQNVDAFAVFVWAFSHFVQLSTCLFMTSYGITQWSNKKNWKQTAIVVLILGCICVVLTSRVALLTNIYRRVVWDPWLFPADMIAIPLILWLAVAWRRRTGRVHVG